MIFITCALHCEAKPLIERYRLIADREAYFPVFSNEGITLVVTGIGRVLTASAMTYVYARYKEPSFTSWVNVGVAGMKNGHIGDLYNVNKVTDQSSGVRWYPVRLQDFSMQNCSLITVDEPCENYLDNCGYDMEASAFMLTALRFSTVELVQVVKIISDNETNGIENIDKKFVSELIANKLNEIDEVIRALLKMHIVFKTDYQQQGLYAQCLDKWHFSEYQKKQLSRILQQWLALDDEASMTQLETCQSGKRVIEFVSKKLQTVDVKFAGSLVTSSD